MVQLTLTCTNVCIHSWYVMTGHFTCDTKRHRNSIYRCALYGLIQGLWHDKLGDTGSLPEELISRLPAMATHLSVSKVQWDRTWWQWVSFGQSDQTGDTNCNRSCVAGQSFLSSQLAPVQRIAQYSIPKSSCSPVMGVDMFKHDFKSLEVSEQSGFLAANTRQAKYLVCLAYQLSEALFILFAPPRPPLPLPPPLG